MTSAEIIRTIALRRYVIARPNQFSQVTGAMLESKDGNVYTDLNPVHTKAWIYTVWAYKC